MNVVKLYYCYDVVHAKCEETKVKLANHTFCSIKAFLVNILTNVNNLLCGFAYLGEYDALFNYGLEVKRKYNKHIDILLWTVTLTCMYYFS